MDACFGDDDSFGSGDAEGDGEFGDGPYGDVVDGAVCDDVLAVGAEEDCWVELVHESVERAVYDLLSSVVEDGACDFVFEVYACYLAYLDGYEFVAQRDEEVGRVCFWSGD